MASPTRIGISSLLSTYVLFLLISSDSVLGGLFSKNESNEAASQANAPYQPIATTNVEPDDSNTFPLKNSNYYTVKRCDYSYEVVFNLIFSEVKLPNEPKYLKENQKVDSFMRDSSFIKNRIYNHNEHLYVQLMEKVMEFRGKKDLRDALVEKVCDADDKTCPDEVRVFLYKFDPQKGNDGVKLARLYSYDKFNVYAYKLNLFKTYIQLLYESGVLQKAENKYWRLFMNIITLSYYGRRVPVKDFDYERITQIAPNFLYDSYYLSLRFGKGVHYSDKYNCFICPQLFNLLVGKFFHMYGLLSVSLKNNELFTIPIKAYFGRYAKFVSRAIIVAGLHVFKDSEYNLVTDILAEGIDAFRQYLIELTPSYKDYVQFIVQKFVDDVHYAIVKASNAKKENIALSDETKVYLSELCGNGKANYSIEKCYYNKKKRNEIVRNLAGVEYFNVRAIAILGREGKNISKYASVARITGIWNKINRAMETLKFWKKDGFKKGVQSLKFWGKKPKNAEEVEQEELGAAEGGEE